MALSKTLQQFLDRMQVEYEVFLHAPTPSASRTAEASHISADKIAKGVLLKDESGYVLAVLRYALRRPDIGAEVREGAERLLRSR